QRNQGADDGDDHQQFDQGEAGSCYGFTCAHDHDSGNKKRTPGQLLSPRTGNLTSKFLVKPARQAGSSGFRGGAVSPKGPERGRRGLRNMDRGSSAWVSRGSPAPCLGVPAGRLQLGPLGPFSLALTANLARMVVPSRTRLARGHSQRVRRHTNEASISWL